VRSLPLEVINNKLDERFRLLTGGSRTALPRQQTLRSLIDWSYDLLHEREKRVLQRLSVFAGGWTLTAAERVCTGSGVEAQEVVDLLTSLVDKSLVIAEQNEQNYRYRLLETVRQYAREELLKSGDGETVRERHRDYFLALAEDAEAQIEGPHRLIGCSVWNRSTRTCGRVSSGDLGKQAQKEAFGFAGHCNDSGSRGGISRRAGNYANGACEWRGPKNYRKNVLRCSMGQAYWPTIRAIYPPPPHDLKSASPSRDNWETSSASPPCWATWGWWPTSKAISLLAAHGMRRAWRSCGNLGTRAASALR
jgi:hypothetical protein